MTLRRCMKDTLKCHLEEQTVQSLISTHHHQPHPPFYLCRKRFYYLIWSWEDKRFLLSSFRFYPLPPLWEETNAQKGDLTEGAKISSAMMSSLSICQVSRTICSQDASLGLTQGNMCTTSENGDTWILSLNSRTQLDSICSRVECVNLYQVYKVLSGTRTDKTKKKEQQFEGANAVRSRLVNRTGSSLPSVVIAVMWWSPWWKTPRMALQIQSKSLFG